MRSDLIDIEVRLLHETPLAWRVTLDEPKDGVWIPKSQGDIELTGHGSLAILTLPEWLALDKGLV